MTGTEKQASEEGTQTFFGMEIVPTENAEVPYLLLGKRGARLQLRRSGNRLRIEDQFGAARTVSGYGYAEDTSGSVEPWSIYY